MKDESSRSRISRYLISKPYSADWLTTVSSKSWARCMPRHSRPKTRTARKYLFWLSPWLNCKIYKKEAPAMGRIKIFGKHPCYGSRTVRDPTSLHHALVKYALKCPPCQIASKQKESYSEGMLVNQIARAVNRRNTYRQVILNPGGRAAIVILTEYQALHLDIVPRRNFRGTSRSDQYWRRKS